MATIQIDRLLETVVKKKASDLHLAVGKPPVLRIRGKGKPTEAHGVRLEFC